MATGTRALQKVDKKTAAETLPVEERIRQRAYEIYLQRGGAEGSEVDDWLQAEEEILGSEPSSDRGTT